VTDTTAKVTLPKAVIKKTVAKKGGKVSITLAKKKDNVTGYRVEISTSKNFNSVKVRYVANTKLTITALQKGKTYYIRACAYNSGNGKQTYGKWSKTVRVKTR
jgi:hypothetical protein